LKKRAILLSLAIILIVIFVRRGVSGNNGTSENNMLGVKYVLKEKDTFISVLRRAQIKPETADSIIEYLSRMTDLRKIKPGETLLIYTDNKLKFKRIEYHKDISEIYTVEYGKKFQYAKTENQERVNVALIEGVIEDNLYNSLIRKKEKGELANAFTKIFEWQCDFKSDVQSGDRYLILIEKIYINGNFYKYGKTLYATLENKEHLYEAFYYKENGVEGYFDEMGASLNSTILKAPLAYYKRISSTFTSKRYHPILKKKIPHYAIDYSAPKGVEVYSAADGIVITKQYDRYGGRTVKIKHENGYITEYMHLNGYSQKLKVGKFVKQGDIIGYVGRSGLATGTHLHYAVKHNGIYINPLKMKFENAYTIKDENKADFTAYTDIMRSFILAVRSVTDFPNICSKKDFIFKYANIADKSAGL